MKLKQFEDFQLYVREKDWGFWQNEVYEPEETKLIKSLVKPDWVCLDIGANIGYFTILMAKQCYWVETFEAEKSNYFLLHENIQLNKIYNITFGHFAVSKERKESLLYLCNTNHGMHRMFKSKFCDKTQKVNVITIDGLERRHGIPRFVKIDVEGSELDVIIGMIDTIRRFKPTILMEFHPPTIIEKGDDPQRLYNLLNFFYDIRLVPNIDETISYEDLYNETMKEPSGRNILCLKK